MRRPLRAAPALLLASLLSFPATGTAQVAREAVDLDVVQRIREEGLARSQVPEMARHLTEVIGPRLTGSPQMAQANAWAAETFRRWGLTNVDIEPWGEFGRGWQMEEYAGRILTPFEQPLHGVPSAWTGSTPGLVRGRAMIARVEGPDDVEALRGTLKGKVLLVDAPAEVDVFQDIERRASLESLLTPPEPRERPAVSDAERQAMYARYRAMRETADALAARAAEEGALALLRISGANDGVIRGGGNGSREPGDPEGLPQVIVSREQYNQIWRNVEADVPVEIELNVRNRFFEDDAREYNVLGEIAGSDKADEYVMIGGHLDSWHFAGGAADNAAGSVVMMEAMRILKTLGLQPRRTVRIALWSGEEQGLLGSRGWVASHPEMHPKISAYLNVDNGTGRIRGIWDQSNEKAIPVFEQILWPFRDLGVVAVKHGDTGGTDHLAFDAVGIPGFNFIQDPIEYSLNTHHTTLDSYDHLVLDDLKQAAVVVASTVWALANREEMMPRKERAAATSGR